MERAALERDVIYLISLSTRRAGAEQAQSTAADIMADASAAGPLSGVWGQGDRVFGGGLGDTFLSKMGVWRTLGADMGVWRDLEGPRGSKV